MTAYVIDPLNPLPPTYGDGEHGLKLKSFDTVVVGKGGVIEAYGSGADGIHGSANNNYLVNGTIFSAQGSGISGSGSVNVGSNGAITGYWAAIELTFAGVNNVLNNAGVLRGTTDNFTVLTNSLHTTINNSGLISGTSGIWYAGDDEASSTLVINNTGTIFGSYHNAISGTWYGSNIVTNSGKIDGGIFFGNGNDVYDGREGYVTEEIFLFGGNDIAYGGAGPETFHYDGDGDSLIDGGSGEDTLRMRANMNVPVTIDLHIVGRQQTTSTSWHVIQNVESILGGRAGDLFIGDSVDNRLVGNGGADTLDGSDGDDVLSGGSGDDVLFGGNGSDVAEFRGAFADFLVETLANGSFRITDQRFKSDGRDTVKDVEFAQFTDRTIALAARPNAAPTSISLDDSIVENDLPVGGLVARVSGVDPDGDALGFHLVDSAGGTFRLHGDKLLLNKAIDGTESAFTIVVRASDPSGASIDQAFTIGVQGIKGVTSVTSVASVASVAPSAAVSEPPDLTLRGGRRADVLRGGGGDDHLNGGLGRDRLIGGTGDDTFAFSTKLKSNADAIADFTSGLDRIQLSKAIFGTLARGALEENAFRIGRKALDGDDRILYDARKGTLAYDEDGTGSAHAAVTFATLKAKAILTAADFMVI